MNMLIYCRVSSDQQVKDGHGLDGQELRCREYAQRHDYNVVKVFRDEGVSGGTIQRPALQEMFSYIRKQGNVDMVLFEDINRIARDLNVHIEVLQTIKQLGAEVQTVNHKLENTPIGKFFAQTFANHAELDRNLNKERVVHKMTARLKSGYWTFDYPPGYKYEKVDGHGKLLVLDKPKAKIIKEALEGFANGRFVTQEQVRQFLEKNHFKHRGGSTIVHPEQVRRLLNRVLYTGYIEFPQWDVPLTKGHHKQIISMDTYQKIQDRLNGKTKSLRVRNDAREDFPLRGFILCGCCNSTLTAQWSKGRNKLHPYYRCNHKDCDYYGKSIRKVELESAFELLLMNVTPQKKVLALVKAVMIDVWQKRSGDVRSLVDTRQKELKGIDTKISNLIDTISESSDKEMKAMYEERIKELKDKKLRLGISIKQKNNKLTEKAFRTALDTTFSFIENPIGMWANGDLKRKQMVLRMIFRGPLVFDKKTGFRTACLSLPVELSNTSKNSYSQLVEMAGIEPASRV